MYAGLSAAINDLATWLQAASQVVPLSQLALVSWFFFVLGGSVRAESPFNISKR
jgi:hypothetical protein